MKIVKLAVIALSILTASVQAEMLSEALLKCSEQDNSLQRLVCYDRIVKDMLQYNGLQQPISAELAQSATVEAKTMAVTPMVPSTAEPATLTPEQRFGAPQKPAEESLDKLVAKVSEINKDPRQRLIITLDNGQVWRQTEQQGIKLAVGDALYIERGVLGAFYLGKNGQNRRMKVKRSH